MVTVDDGGTHNDGATATELARVEDAWASALVSNDVARIDQFIAADWVHVTGSGLTSREHFLSVIESGKLEHTAMSPRPPSRVRVHGDVAVLSGRVISTARWDGHEFDADEWQTDVFVRSGHGWTCTLTHLSAAEPE